MRNETTGDDFFETMLRRAVIENFEKELEGLPSEEELSKQYTFSKRHQRHMAEIFAKDKRIKIKHVIINFGKVAVITISIATSVLLFSSLISEDVRAAIGRVMIEWFETFTEFQSDKDLNSTASKEGEWLPTYIPNGFKLESTFDMKDIFTVVYSNDEDIKILYSYTQNNSEISSTNENKNYEIITDEGTDYYVFKSDDNKRNVIIWDIYELKYTISSGVSAVELLKMAKSVER